MNPVSGNLGIVETKGPGPSPTGVCSLEGNRILRPRASICCLMYKRKILDKGSVQIAEEAPRTGQRTYRWEPWGVFYKLGLEGCLGVF